MGAPDGGDAPSVEAQISTAVAAIGAGMPALTSATTATGPTAAMVALAVSGIAIRTMITEMARAVIQSGASGEAGTSASCSARPSSARTPEAENAAMMVMPMTPNDGAALASVCHH